MKALFLAVALAGEGVASGSLGIGFDVLPEAYMFAARRLGRPVIMHLKSCTQTRCLWDLGNGVMVAADLSGNGLDINRIEARLDARLVDRPDSRDRYTFACRTIVALAAPSTPAADQAKAARAIASGDDPQTVLEGLERDIRVYGTGLSIGAKPSPIRCGAFST